MSEQHGFPQPTPEHALLNEICGRWNVACTYFMDPSQPPMEVQAVETVEMVGPFWRVSRFEADMFGMPFHGSATIGYEPTRERWVSTWIDSLAPHLYNFTGQRDAETGVLEMRGEGLPCETGEPTKLRTREERVGPDERKFEMFSSLPDGTEHRMASYHYTRAR